MAQGTLMKIIIHALLLVFASHWALAANNQTNQNSADNKMSKELEVASYAIGMNLANHIEGQAPDLNEEMFFKGFSDGLNDRKPQYTEEELNNHLASYQQKVQQRMQEQYAKVAEENHNKGKAFLAENGKKSGVKTTDSGLQYKVITEGNGKIPTKNDKVTTHYAGRLIDGTEFDSSIARGEPATFPVNGVIPGWTEALQKMKVGSKWQLFIPSELAYGPRGAGASIPPNSTLIFDIELLSIAD